MTTDSYLALLCMSMFGLFFGAVLTFGGYRFFLFLLPIWGFFFGFGFGAQTIQAIFGVSFLADITSWVVGFFVALLFAALSYLFYAFAVGLIAGSFGYSLGAGLMLAILPSLTFTAWLVGVIVGVILAVAVLALNIQKYVIIVATALQGAGIIVGIFVILFGGVPSEQVTNNAVNVAINSSPLWTILVVVLAALGIGSQLASTRRWEIATYNRWDETFA